MANSLMGMMSGAQSAPLANPQMQNMRAIRQAAQSAKRMMGMLQAVKDPQAALMQVAQQNPQLNAVMQMCNGRNPQEVFYEECQKSGVNPDEVMNLLRS
ncbi:MAG: hypothetical protein HDR01_05645 [Lachnospiraceae bacterium]|nr:hypothetical protein [Lachnospiraceae bacterium]